jgi:hypothetical protein
MTDKDQYIKDLNEDLKYSVSKFDTETLTIGGGALGLSLTFVKDIVPFNQSVWIILFYFSLGIFILSISLGFIGHYISMKQISRSIKLVSEEKYSELTSDQWIPKINLFVAITITIGILMLVTYCVINIEHQRQINIEPNRIKKLEIKNKTQNGVEFLIEGELKNFNYKDSTENSSIKIK